MTVKLLTEQNLECLSLTGVCTGSSESTLVETPHCWKSHVVAQMSIRARFNRSPSHVFQASITTIVNNLEINISMMLYYFPIAQNTVCYMTGENPVS